MTNALWASVDAYFDEALIPPDAALSAALAASEAAGLPSIQVTPAQGKLLALFVSLMGARRVLEIGTLGGYSTIWMARALPPGGTLLSLELDPRHAEVARASIAHAGLADRVTIWTGPALSSLARLQREASAPFDLVFIDADKANIDQYFRHALAVSRPGTLIVLDNVVREGAVLDATSPDPSVQGVRRLVADLARARHVSAVALQTVAAKGYDGFILARVVETSEATEPRADGRS